MSHWAGCPLGEAAASLPHILGIRPFVFLEESPDHALGERREADGRSDCLHVGCKLYTRIRQPTFKGLQPDTYCE